MRNNIETGLLPELFTLFNAFWLADPQLPAMIEAVANLPRLDTAVMFLEPSVGAKRAVCVCVCMGVCIYL
jgi:hypothetical protein